MYRLAPLLLPWDLEVTANADRCPFRHLEDLEVIPHPPKYLSCACPFRHLEDLEEVPHPQKCYPR